MTGPEGRMCLFDHESLHRTDRTLNRSALVLKHMHLERPAGELVAVPRPPLAGYEFSSRLPLKTG